MAQISWPAAPSVRITVTVPDPPMMSSLDGLDTDGKFSRISDYISRATDWMQRAKEQIEILAQGNAELQDFLEHLLDAIRPLQLIGNDIEILAGEGTPEAAITANVGSLFLRTDGAASTTVYIKETGTSNTGWRAV